MNEIRVSSFRPIVKILATIATQAAAFSCAIIAFSFVSNLFFVVLAATAAACLTAKLLRLSGTWFIINSALPICIFLARAYHAPALPFLLLTIILLLVFLPTLFQQVPFYPTQNEIYFEVLRNLPHKDIRFIDLGCGTAALLFFLAKKLPNSNFVGIELSPLAYWVASLRKIIFRQKNLQIVYGDFWKLNFADYDVIYAFLAPPPMQQLFQKFKQEARVGTLALINSFPFPADHLHQSAEYGARKQKLYCYRN